VRTLNTNKDRVNAHFRSERELLMFVPLFFAMQEIILFCGCSNESLGIVVSD